MDPTNAIKVLSFRNCELHCCHLDGYKEQSEAFLKRLSDIEQYFLSKPDTSRFRLWYNIDETTLDKVLIDEVAASISRMQKHIIKVVFIGLSKFQQVQMERKLKAYEDARYLPHAYYRDAEKAKEWLI